MELTGIWLHVSLADEGLVSSALLAISFRPVGTLRRTVGVRPPEQQERQAKWAGRTGFLDSWSWRPLMCLASRAQAVQCSSSCNC